MKNNMNSSISLLVTFATGALGAAGVLASGYTFDGAVVLSILFAAGIAGWTCAQYQGAPQALAAGRPIRQPLRRECAARPDCPALPLAA
jgi:hypothetical protein